MRPVSNTAFNSDSGPKIGRLTSLRFNVPTVIARILDPYRAEWYEQQGLHTICPTRVAIEMLEAEVKEAAAKVAGGA